MLSDKDSYFKSFRRLKKSEKYPEFNIMYVEFTASNPNFPNRAIVKEYSDCSPGALREMSMLMELSESSEHVIKYLHHLICKQKLYLFLEYCPDTLAREIAARKGTKKYWTEGELIVYLKDAVEALCLLHLKRIVHRNINPFTLLLANGHMKLAHFQNSKQIHVGLTVQMSSEHGYETFVSPEMHYALKEGRDGISYQATYKDDIWSLGRSFYDMMTLKNNEEIVTLFEEGERGFAVCLEREMRARYSEGIVNIVLKMLALHTDSRPDSSRLLEDIQPLYNSLRTCSMCTSLEGVCGRMLQLCAHCYCSDCTTALVTTAVKANGTQETLRCPTCDAVIFASVEREVRDVSLRTQLDLLRLNNLVKCVTEGCPQKHPQLQIQSGSAKAYLVSCACGAKYCSYCHVTGGHGLFGIFSRCPAIPLV